MTSATSMAVPCSDEQDDFNLLGKFTASPITNIIGDAFNGLDANPTKDAILKNSDFLDGLVMKDAILIVHPEDRREGYRRPERSTTGCGMPLTAGNAIGASPFRSPERTGMATPLSTKGRLPLEGCPILIIMVPALKERGRWRIYPRGPPGIWRRIPCRVMRAAAGISSRYMDPDNRG